MARRVERLEGLALVGSARVGPLGLPTPTWLDPRVDGIPSAEPGPTLRERETTPGLRHLTLANDGAVLELKVPILAPEVTGPPSGPIPIGPGTVLVHAPLGPTDPEVVDGRTSELIVLGNARGLWNEGLPFVRAVRDLRDRFGGAPLVWAPRVALPHRVAFLCYLGIDLLDGTEGLLAAARGEFLDLVLGTSDRSLSRAEHACGCASCRSDPPGPLAEHARATYRHAVAEARGAARQGRLRELVESRLTSEPALAEMLRYADRELGPLLDERAPVVGEGSRFYALTESHRRPEMVRFRRRLRERYRPPPSKTVLLLVPCSKTKPYRASRSHRRFASALEGLPALERLHLVSVSSPIGVVPRELEDVPPARHYDIPVTGDWSESERQLVSDGVRHLLATGAYRSVVVHLDPAEYAFLRPALAGPIPVRWTLLDDHTTSNAALAALRSAVEEELRGATPVPGGPLAVVREELHELASVQFGRTAADRLLAAPVRLAGRPWFQRLTDGRSDLATVREERGLLFLTVAGARRLDPDPPLAVAVDPGLPLTGDLFTPGVRGADPEIRVGDSVVLRREGLLAAVGEAVLPGRLMTELDHGLAVRIRHRVGSPTDTAKTEDAPATESGPVV
jgi:archaeosine synthase alpha-subunit